LIFFPKENYFASGDLNRALLFRCEMARLISSGSANSSNRTYSSPMRDRPSKSLYSVPGKRRCILGASVATLIATLVLGSSSQVLAASAGWDASPTDANWVATGGENNWSTGAATFPGATSGTASADVATFGVASSLTNITINSLTLNIGSITFSGAAAA
jgi:hypothetical protein